METTTYVRDLVAESLDTISPDESVTVARRRMESQTARSLIVVEGDRPVGIVQWRGLSQQDGGADIRSVMQTDFPVLKADMPISEVRDYLTGLDVDIDHLPVVDDGGALIGEVPRGAITRQETAMSSATQEAISGPEADRGDVPTIHLEQGMKVIGVQGSKLGTIDEVDVNADGHISHFSVKYGMLGRHAKRLPADVIKHVSDDEVHLSLDQMEFKMLADIGAEV